MKISLAIVVTIVVCQIGFSQNYKFGKVSKEELEEKYYPEDSTANAVFLYKKRITSFNYIKGEGFVVETKVHERIKIYNKEGYDWATKDIAFYDPEASESEKVNVKEAKTFSLVDGKPQSFKLNKKDIFHEKKNKYWAKKKFTMPNLSEGCIIEWEYVLVSPYYGISNIEMQFAIPVKKFESSIAIPEYFTYSTKVLGYLPINSTASVRNSTINFTNTNRATGTGFSQGSASISTSSVKLKINISVIEEENIPALIEEPYVNRIDNYRAGVDYELASIKWPNKPYKYFSQTWEDVGKTIYNNPDFGGELKKHSHLSEDISILKSNLISDADKIVGALTYVKNKIKWNDYYSKYSEKGLRKAYKDGFGNIADVNLTLVIVLRELGLDAHPVLVSTRKNGVPIFPTLSGFNYVIAAVKMPQGSLLLDASEQYSLPQVLPLRVLNWKGLLVNETGEVEHIDLNNSSKLSEEDCRLSYKINVDGYIEGMNRVTYKNMHSMNYRTKKGKLDKDDLISNIEESNDDIEIINFRLSNKEDILKPIVEMYTFEKEDGIEIIGNKMYLEPLLFQTTSENPFKLESRLYPVDFGTPWKNKLVASIQIPEGYKVESIPDPMGISFGGEMGKFTYSIEENMGKLKISSVVQINSGIVSANYYPDLKEFYKKIVSKQTEKIVLSKI